MAHLLFPAGKSITKGRRKDEYHVLSTDIVRARIDAVDALTLFHNLIAGADRGDEAPGYMSFDAHVGETGCHLRAGIVEPGHVRVRFPSAIRSLGGIVENSVPVPLYCGFFLVRPASWAGRRNLVSFATFKKPTYLFYVSGAFLVFWGLFGPFDYLPAFALYTVSIINYRNLLGGLVVFAIVFGFKSGAFVSLMTPAIIEVAGGHNSELGVMLSTFFVVVAAASLTSLPIQTATVTERDGGGYDMLGLIAFCGVSMLLGSALLGWTARLAGKRKAGAAS
ncbi:hypothetical protein PG993_008614 [Apiospora rasikravindrae]|uniref:Uncharacterized protein n=1 Tax=Apiospora rasikravindrae TaxID=990691 RepID=A0ABR1T398_9PEZI